MGIFDKAKEATSSASAKAAEVKQQVAAKAGEIKEQAATKAGEIKEQAAAKAGALKDSAAAMGNDLMESTSNKVKDTLRDFNGALPIVREAGYKLAEVAVELGIPPKIQATFDTTHHISESAVQEITERHADNKFAVVLVKSLFQAQKLQSGIKFVGLAPRGITVELGLIPTLAIKFGAPLTIAGSTQVARHDSEAPVAIESAS